MIGDEVIPVRSLLEIKHPLSEGIIKDRDDMELLWKYAIHNKLKVPEADLRNYKTMLTEAPMNPTKNKETMAEIIFERIGVGAFNIEPQAKLSLICEGLDTGIVLDSGDGVTHCIPIYSNMILHHHIKRLNIAGRSITDQLIKLLQVR
jgi:actin-related protein 2